MKKFLMALLVLAMTVCGVVGIAACGEKEKVDEGQNQGQVAPNKDKDKDEDTQKPNAGSENKPGSGETTPSGGTDDKDEGNKGEEGKNPPTNPEEQKPGTQNPPTNPNDDKDEDKPTTPDPDKPQGDEPGENEPGTDNPTTEPDKGNTGDSGNTGNQGSQGQGEQGGQGQGGTDTPTKPDTPKDPVDDHQHVIVYEAHGTDRSNMQHVGKCSICSKVIVPAAKCTYPSTPNQTVQPTCTEDGYEVYTCSVCSIDFISYGVTRTGGHKYPKLGHQFEGKCEPVLGTATHRRQCTRCSEYETQACTFKGDYTAPTCENYGVSNRKCTVCGCDESSDPDLLKPLEHEWEYTPTTTGHSRRCLRNCCASRPIENDVCHYEVSSETSACTGNGVKLEVCKECGKTKRTTTSPTGHKMNDGVVTKEPSCTEKGTMTYTCSVCGATQTKDIPANGHRLDKGDGFQSDYTGHKGKCTVCHQNVGEDKLEAHVYSDVDNFCLACGFDGVYANGCYSLSGGIISLYKNGNGFLNTAKTVVLAEFPFAGWGPLVKITAEPFSTKCWNIENIYIPGTVNEIASNAFAGCSGLKNIYYGGTKEDWDKMNVTLGAGVTVDYQKEYDQEKKGPKEVVKKSSTVVATEQPALLIDKRSY